MKAICIFLLLAVGSAQSSPVENSKESLMYPYGTSEGDSVNPKSDDGTSPEIIISVPFTFYGKPYTSLYVNNNGVVSFGVNVSQFTPDPFPLDGGSPFVAPYWADVNNILGGNVYWRQTTNQQILSRCTADINHHFSLPLPLQVNTFQAVLATDAKISFIILNYANIEWTTGIASGGNAKTGLGGTPAQAGFDSGDKKNFYNIPGSRTPDILKIGETTNVQVPGRWVFQVDDFVIGVTTEANDCLL
ncbi:hypothetical protein lerEdw1_013478 [Lerista edwardsae]|nr:hypothetical protein lerEdw1_013480 [Lerista edwardsae]KAJ6650245.1 hypothetical protein lerEdw1_013478 [Lerista edwardsae]